MVVTAALMAAGPVSHGQLARGMDTAAIQRHVAAMAGLGSRVSGYPGNAKAADYVLGEFKRLGLETYVQEFDLPTPLDNGCSAEVKGKRYEIGAMWPNLVRTAQVTPDGLRGPLIYVGPGQLSDFDGKPVENAIVLMDFNTSQNWLNAALLGASAVVFLQPPTTTRGEAEVKYLQVPVSFPRFYASSDAAADLMATAAGGTPRARCGRRSSGSTAPTAM